MATIIELRMDDGDRKKYGGPEWVPLDADRLVDAPAAKLARWEREIEATIGSRYAIELALAQCSDPHPPAIAVWTLIWMARKQGGDLVGGTDEQTGQPERFARLADLKTMLVRIRDASTADPEGDDANPPARAATPPEPSPEP